MSAPTATAIVRGVAAGELQATEVVAAALARARRLDPDLGCFVETFDEQALAAAEAIDRRRAAGKPLGPLAGLPVAIKDNLLRAGQVAACGSRMLERFVAPCSSTAVERLEQAGAVIVGRTNMDEFGMGSSTERSAFFPTRNPHDRQMVPGGSSGGSAAAVAADLCPIALGTDTGGSVRQPAALCGVSGLKPTYGRIPRWGLVAYASSLDTVGVLARTAEDLALVLDVLAGPDPRDSTCLPDPWTPRRPGLADAAADLHGLRVGLVDGVLDPARGTDAEVAAAVSRAIATLGGLGAATAPVALPRLGQALPAYYLIATAEASSNLARYDGVRFGLRVDDPRLEAMMARSRAAGFGDEVQLRILLGTFALRAGYHDELYGRATRVRTLVRQDFAAAFARCDVIATPTSPVPAFPLGSRTEDPAAMYACDLLTVPASLAGLPALSIPCGATAAGLPVGLQLIAPAGREDRLLAVAHAYQQATDHHLRRPLP